MLLFQNPTEENLRQPEATHRYIFNHPVSCLSVYLTPVDFGFLSANTTNSASEPACIEFNHTKRERIRESLSVLMYNSAISLAYLSKVH